MKHLYHIFKWLSLAGICGLILLSIAGAFLGADRAKALFNTTPLAMFWSVLLVLLAAGTLGSLLRRRLALAAIHLGCLLIIAGGMWGSVAGHALRQRYGDETRHPRAWMMLHLGRPGRLLLKSLEGGTLLVPFDELPFAIEATDADIIYYPVATPSQPPVAADYLVTLLAGQDGLTLAEQTVEVNHPMHAGGYQFTLSRLDLPAGQVLLQVTSDAGLRAVWAGFALLCLGAFGACWLGPVVRRRRPV